MCKAHEQLNDAAFLEAAKRSGEAVWERGLLMKGPGLCHGISGSCYALLRLYRATGDQRWLRRTLHFAEFMDRQARLLSRLLVSPALA
jgi:lantibiotic modifying enzyme